MPKKLKIDLHTHSAEDPYERISHTAFQLIDRASEEGYDVLAIANHNTITYNRELAEYGCKRGVLLIPGVEARLSGKHVLILNPDFKEVPSSMDLADLLRLKSPASLIIAPHPFFPGPNSLKSDLLPYLRLFDAIEYSHFYNHLINWNKKAIDLAESAGRPLVGSSDCHSLQQLGTTYSLVEAEKDIRSVLKAIKQGRVEVCTSALSLISMIKIGVDISWRRRKFIFTTVYRESGKNPPA